MYFIIIFVNFFTIVGHLAKSIHFFPGHPLLSPAYKILSSFMLIEQSPKFKDVRLKEKAYF